MSITLPTAELEDITTNIDEQTAQNYDHQYSERNSGSGGGVTGSYSPNSTLNCMSIWIFILSVVLLAGGLFCVIFLLGYAVPLFRSSKVYNASIVRSDVCFLTNYTKITPLVINNKIGSYFDVHQPLATEIDGSGGGGEKILQPAFCGRFLSKVGTSNRTFLVSELLKNFGDDPCIARMDAVNETFPCWYNSDESALSDPRVTAQQLSEYKLLIAVLSIICFLVFLASVILIPFSSIVIVRDNMNDRTGGKKSNGFIASMLTNMGLQACMVSFCCIMPWLGWMLWPIGTYIGFLVFGVMLVLLILLVAATIVSLVFIRLYYRRVHLRYFKMLLIVFLAVSFVAILYQIGLIYPVGISGLQFISRSNFLY